MIHNLEKILILAFYKIDKTHNLEKFAKQYQTYFKSDISQQTLCYEVSKCHNIDPVFNMRKEDVSKEYIGLWNYYVNEGRIDLLKEIYKSFKKGEDIENVINDLEEDFFKQSEVDKPIGKPNIISVNEVKVQRDQSVLAKALANANYVCELNCSHELFVSRKSNKTYTEGHHLIPLKYQNRFEYSLDVTANIVSLCPICHREIHYGTCGEEKIKELYLKRIDRLKNCKIGISLEQLLAMYNEISDENKN